MLYAIPLEVTDTKAKNNQRLVALISQTSNINLGDMAEGVVGAAIAARFMYKNRNISIAHVYLVFFIAYANPENPSQVRRVMETTKNFPICSMKIQR